MRVRTHVNPLSYITRMPKINYDDIFDIKEFLDFEIGSGNGDFLLDYAKNHQERNIIGVEIRKSLAEKIQNNIKNMNIKNAFLVYGRAEICLEDTIDDESIDKIFIFHPDPWIKKKHYKRRIINEKFLEIIYKKLKKNGLIYISTDVEELWINIRKIFDNFKFFKFFNKNDDFWVKDYNTYWTKFSKKINKKIYFGVFLKI